MNKTAILNGVNEIVTTATVMQGLNENRLFIGHFDPGTMLDLCDHMDELTHKVRLALHD